MNEHNLVILYSGGLESRFLLELAIKLNYNPYCVLIDYGQKHIKELDVAEIVCTKLNVMYEIIKIDWSIKSALTSAHNSDGEDIYKGVSHWYVPARNLIFVSIAAAIAESHGIDTIWFGASYDDRLNLFPDCYQEWVVSMNELLEKTMSTKIQLLAPLCGMSKHLIEQVIEKTNIDLKEVWSGYRTE